MLEWTFSDYTRLDFMALKEQFTQKWKVSQYLLTLSDVDFSL